MTINEHYRDVHRQWKEAEAHFVGQLDALYRLVAAGLGDTAIPEPEPEQETADTEMTSVEQHSTEPCMDCGDHGHHESAD